MDRAELSLFCSHGQPLGGHTAGYSAELLNQGSAGGESLLWGGLPTDLKENRACQGAQVSFLSPQLPHHLFCSSWQEAESKEV